MLLTVGQSELFDLDVTIAGRVLVLVLERKRGRLWWALGARDIWWSGLAPVV
jgi:hypothetical protein